MKTGGVINVSCTALSVGASASKRPCTVFASRLGRAGEGRMHALKTIRCDTGNYIMKKKQNSKKEKVPPLPTPQEYQQTLLKSFTMGGVGLHTGEYAYVCVRPAMAGEGRYFVRVPPGTNADNYQEEAPGFISHEELDIKSGADDRIDAITRAQIFLKYKNLEPQDEGYEGGFGEYLSQELEEPSDAMFLDAAIQRPAETPSSRSVDDVWLPASIDYADAYQGAAIILQGTEGFKVLSPESLLSALEACGVDNARIEVEGGWEVPVVDGSALGWVLEIQKAGLREAPSSSGDNRSHRTAPNPQDMLTVSDGDAFVSFYPGKTARVTAGVDHTAEAIGRQWFTWGPADSTQADNYDNHYRWEVAPARKVFPSAEVVESMYASGLLRAGVENCCLVATDGMWLDPMLERFAMEDASRNAVAILMGNLALVAPAGGRGLPQGHVVAYKASPELQLQFTKSLRAKCQEWEYAQVSE